MFRSWTARSFTRWIGRWRMEGTSHASIRSAGSIRRRSIRHSISCRESPPRSSAWRRWACTSVWKAARWTSTRRSNGRWRSRSSGGPWTWSRWISPSRRRSTIRMQQSDEAGFGARLKADVIRVVRDRRLRQVRLLRGPRRLHRPDRRHSHLRPGDEEAGNTSVVPRRGEGPGTISGRDGHSAGAAKDGRLRDRRFARDLPEEPGAIQRARQRSGTNLVAAAGRPREVRRDGHGRIVARSASTWASCRESWPPSWPA